ncbi:hypothetical protein PMAYCL1PPCAC_03371, partial [Pristionchus mayeri]
RPSSLPVIAQLMTPEMDNSVRRRRKAAKEIKVKIVERTHGRRGFRKKWQLLLAIALFLQTMGSLIYYHRLSSSSSDPADLSSLTEEQKEELRAHEPAIIRNLTDGTQFLLGRFCDSANDCFTILQRYWWNGEGLTAQRIIQYELAESWALTMSFLVTPEIVTAHYLDHTRWRVDHARPVWSYNLMQIAAGFMLEGLSFGRNSSSQPLQQQRVLQIGMGGGSATGFLSTMELDLHIDVVELEPAVYEAAKRWFDFPQSPNIDVHIMDGVVFLRKAVEAGLTFDSLILDTSVNSANATQVCPHPAFMQEQVMKDMSKVIGNTGVLSVNVFLSDQLKNQEEIAAKFTAYFKSCSALTITSYGQKFVVCTNREGFDWARQRQRMFANLAEFDDVIGTRIAPTIDKLNPVISDL